jgi:PPM family protein phosphatase
MKFNICGFTHKGTGAYLLNEDNMLLNGSQLNGGNLFLQDQDKCICFVSDGVGGNSAGDFASAFLLMKINELAEQNPKDLKNMLYKVNEDLFKISSADASRRGCACTLSGIIAVEGFVDFIHVGDSEIWLFRNEMFFKVTQDEVTDPDDWKSPLTNYFGGTQNVLKIKTDWFTSEFLARDIFLICSDGLFKSLNIKLVKSIISSDKTIREKVMKLKENCLALGSDDNVTAVIIEILSI